MKKIILILTIFIILILLYNNVAFVRNLIAKTLLPRKFLSYTFLSENKVESNDARITKIIDGEIDGDIMFNTLTQEFLVKVRDPDYDKNNQNWHAIWKIDRHGGVLDSISTNNEMYTNGIYFKHTYFIDWANSGNKSKQKYKRIINFDSTSSIDMDSYFERAETIVYGVDYENKILRGFLKIEKNWIVVESKNGFEKDYRTNIKETFKYKAKNSGLLILLKNTITPNHHWRDLNSFIYLQKFVEESREHKSFYDVNNTSRSAWQGTGYFQLVHYSNFFYFKAHIFKSAGLGGGYKPSISYYEAPKYRGYVSDIGFIVLDLGWKLKRDYKEVGLYVIHRKEKN